MPISISIFESNSNLIWLIVTMAFIALLYFAMFEYKLQQTIGKMVLGLYVVSEKGGLSIWQAVGRSIFILPIFPFILLWIIDPIYLIFKKIRLSEILTRTMTVEEVKR